MSSSHDTRIMLISLVLQLLLTACHCGVFDMPLKKCPADGNTQVQVAYPRWLDMDQWAAGCENSFKPAGSAAVELSNQYFYVGHVASPYRHFLVYNNIDEVRHGRNMRVHKWSMNTLYGNTLMIEQFKVRFSGDGKEITTMGEWDHFTSAVFLGDRHILLTTNANSGSKVGRVVLVDVMLFGTTYTNAVQLFPMKGPIPQTTPSAIYGCHADSFTPDTLIAHNKPMQDFFTVCMYTKDSKMFLGGFNVSIHTSDLERDLLVNGITYNFNTWTNPPEMEFTPIDFSWFAASLQTYPVHVIGKRTVLYRCMRTFNGVAGVAHWCWRNFAATEWGVENPALTTAALNESVLYKGMFIGWSGSESTFEPNSRRVYFLDRNSRRLYTLAIHDNLDTVFTNVLTGMYQGTEYTNPLHFDLSPPRPMYFYGQVNHLYDFKWWLDNTMPVSVDEYLYLIGGGGYGYCNYRQVCLWFLQSLTFFHFLCMLCMRFPEFEFFSFLYRFFRSPCSPCKKCNPPWTFMVTKCDSFINRPTECQNCKRCEPGYYVNKNCTDKLLDDATCMKCTKNEGNCGSGWKPRKPCTGNTFEDSIDCVPCTEKYEDDYFQVTLHATRVQFKFFHIR